MTFVVPPYIQQLIRDYKAAYERANGKPAPILTYTDGGWFHFDDLRPRYRRAAIEEMLECLRERPAYPIPPANCRTAAGDAT